mgnify:CR=1 FL=1
MKDCLSEAGPVQLGCALNYFVQLSVPPPIQLLGTSLAQEADEDGSGELDIDEFTQKLGPHLGKHLSEAQIAQLFLKIDADCGGTIDWSEFTNYFFLQRGVTNAGEDQQRFCLYPKVAKGPWRCNAAASKAGSLSSS